MRFAANSRRMRSMIGSVLEKAPVYRPRLGHGWAAAPVAFARRLYNVSLSRRQAHLVRRRAGTASRAGVWEQRRVCAIWPKPAAGPRNHVRNTLENRATLRKTI